MSYTVRYFNYLLAVFPMGHQLQLLIAQVQAQLLISRQPGVLVVVLIVSLVVVVVVYLRELDHQILQCALLVDVAVLGMVMGVVNVDALQFIKINHVAGFYQLIHVLGISEMF